MAPKKKPQKQNNKGASSSSSSKSNYQKPSADPKLQISAENEDRLRRLLLNSGRTTPPITAPINNSLSKNQKAKKLTNFYEKLSCEGFVDDQIELALSSLRAALDWAMLEFAECDIDLTHGKIWDDRIEEEEPEVLVGVKGMQNEEDTTLSSGKSSQADWIRQYMMRQRVKMTKMPSSLRKRKEKKKKEKRGEPNIPYKNKTNTGSWVDRFNESDQDPAALYFYFYFVLILFCFFLRMEMESCKLFIGGISWETCEDRLRDYFQSFGEVLEAVIMKDRATGRARGFGFVVFADPNVAERVVLLKHIIDGKVVEAKKAVPREDHAVLNKSNSSLQGSPGPANTKKIFVGGLASSVTEAEFKKYFSQFGVITDVVVMYDHRTQRPRGFGFISFDSEDAVDKVLQRTFHELNGKMVEVKLAVPKEMALNTIRNQINVNNFGSGRISALLNEYTQGFSPSPISGYGVKHDVRYSPGVGNRGGFSPFGHGYGIELNFEPNQTPNYGSGSSGGFGRPFSPGYAASLNRYGNQMELGGASVGNGSMLNAATKNQLWGNGGLGYMSNSPISRSSFSGNSGMSSLGSIGDNWGTAARARNSYRSEGGGLGLEAMRGVHVGGYNSGSSSLDTDSLYSDSMWLSLPPKAEEGLGMGALDFMSRGPAGYINRQPNGGIAA